MERAPRRRENFTPEITPSEEGIDVVVARRNAWHFTNNIEAARYFRRRQIQFSALQWGVRALTLAGVVDVVHGIDQTIKTHDPFTGASALIISGLSLIVQGLNEHTIGDRVRLHREVARRFSQPRS